MEASSSCSCPNVRVKRGVTRCWRTLHPTVDCRLHGLAGCKLWLGERNRTLLRGLYLHPTAPTAHHSEHFRAVPADCGVFLLVPADSARGRVSPQAAHYTLAASCVLQGATVGRVESVLYGTVCFFKWGV